MMENSFKRGYSSIAVTSPKDVKNIGGILRAAGNYQVSLVVLGNIRVTVRSCADTMKAYRHIPVVRVDDVFEALPFDCVPIAVDILDTAMPLPKYIHPERAFYIFGAEDQTLGKNITDKCRDIIFIPTNRCMNLAAATNVVLYDRMVKRGENHARNQMRMR